MTAPATPAPLHLATDVLVIGAGGAGMYAAIEAARGGASVLLADRALIGRGGATVMAMTTGGMPRQVSGGRIARGTNWRTDSRISRVGRCVFIVPPMFETYLWRL